MNFENKVAISTGAASGIVLLFAERFTSLGGSVLMRDVDGHVFSEKVSVINAKDVGRNAMQGGIE